MQQSSGIVLYKFSGAELLFLLVHPGGPFWKNKDAGAWSIPKGEYTDGEDPLAVAIREFHEETGILLDASENDFRPLRPVRLKSGKTVHAWALERDVDLTGFTSNTFEIEWPPRSGNMQSFPEVDKAEWFPAEAALQKINEAQQAFIREVAGFEAQR
jgi:predicted NUDIX family NTP pyrophosphohydrolase